MPLSADVKKKIMSEYATHEGDTGSPEVQVAMLTQRILDLTEHSASTSTTTTAGAACCCWSASAAGSCATSRASTSSVTAR